MVLGKDVTVQKADILRHIGSMIDVPVFYEHLSAKENLNIHLAYMGVKKLIRKRPYPKSDCRASEISPFRSFHLV